MMSDNLQVESVSVKSLISSMYPVIAIGSDDTGVQPNVIVVFVVKIQ